MKRKLGDRRLNADKQFLRKEFSFHLIYFRVYNFFVPRKHPTAEYFLLVRHYFFSRGAVNFCLFHQFHSNLLLSRNKFTKSLFVICTKKTRIEEEKKQTLTLQVVCK